MFGHVCRVQLTVLLSSRCDLVSVSCSWQVELMWQKFGAGIWQALAGKYPEIDMDQVWTFARRRLYSRVY